MGNTIREILDRPRFSEGDLSSHVNRFCDRVRTEVMCPTWRDRMRVARGVAVVDAWWAQYYREHGRE